MRWTVRLAGACAGIEAARLGRRRRAGTGPTPLLRPLPVDLEELAGVLEGDPMFGAGRVDLLTGQVWPRAAIEYARQSGEEGEDEPEDPDRWL